jgi:hypothetical protein
MADTPSPFDETPEDIGPPVADVSVPDEGRIYNPDRDRERTRSILALGVLGLVFVALAAIVTPVVSGKRDWQEIEGLAAAVLPAVFGITGSVLAFYFATEQKRQ